MSSSVLHTPTDSTTQALTELSKVSRNFEEKYRRVVELCRQPHLPLTLCTIYNGSFPAPDFQQMISTAVMVFNDVILRVAIEFGIPVIDLQPDRALFSGRCKDCTGHRQFSVSLAQ
jgi:hypothetical protein